MKFVLALALAIPLHAQAPDGKAKPDPGEELQALAVKFVEMTGGRERLVAALPEMVGQGKAEMKKQCPDCADAFIEEWGKRFTARLKTDEFVQVAARAYAKRFTLDELNEFLAVVASQKTDKKLPLSDALQKKFSELMPVIMGEIVGGSTEIGAKLGREVAVEIEKEHPEYFPKRKPDQQ